MSEPITRLLAALGAPPSAETVSDADLLARAVYGREHVALELLVRRHAALVWRVCLAVTRDPHAADDAFQATFLALVRNPKAIRGPTTAGWLYRVAYRLARRAAQRRPDRPVLDVPSGAPGPLERMEQTETAAAVHAALSRLPEKYREPVILCHLEGCTQSEAARLLGIPLGTVAVRVRRGLERVREALTALPAAAAAGIGVAQTRHVGAAPAQVIVRACEVASGSAAPTRTVAALAARAGAGAGSGLAGLTVLAGALGFLGIALAGSGEQPKAGDNLAPGATRIGLNSPVTIQTTAGPETPPDTAHREEPILLPFSVTTSLQRKLLGGDAGCGSVVFVSRAAIRTGPDREEARERAFAVIRRSLEDGSCEKGRPVLFYCPKVDPAGPRDRHPDLAAEPLMQAGRLAGFSDVRFAHGPGTLAENWSEAVREAMTDPAPGTGEAGVDAGGWIVYPVRTPLSRLLSGGADCVLEASGAALADREADELQSVRAALDSFGPCARNSVLVLCPRADNNRRWSQAVGQALGFGRVTSRFSPDTRDGRGHGPPHASGR